MSANAQPNHDENRGEEPIEEPENSKVDDWFGQRVDRDKELAEDIAADTDDPEEAARRFEQEKEGSRPEDLPTEERP